MLEIQLDRARFQLIKVKTILEWNSRERRIKGEKIQVNRHYKNAF
jgi:hypothetical protein